MRQRIKLPEVTATRITGSLLDGSEHEAQAYSADAFTFRAIWKAAV